MAVVWWCGASPPGRGVDGAMITAIMVVCTVHCAWWCGCVDRGVVSGPKPALDDGGRIQNPWRG